MNKFALLFASTALAAVPAQAQQVEAEAPPAAGAEPEEPHGDHVHHEEPEEIVVTAPYLRDLDLLAGTTALTGTDLTRELRPQIGDTLARLPGVSATSFSPGASRPVLRGFQGERIRVLTDGIGSIDVSNTSADHAVTIDPLTAERIEVLHGPAVLLFGSQAIGGAVNVFDRRIPRVVPDQPVHVDGIAAYGSATNERSIGAAADAPLGSGIVLHVDGSYRNTDDLRVGGYVLSPALRQEQIEAAAEEAEEGHAEEAEEALELANLRGHVPNTATETWTAGVGLALIQDTGNIGVSVSWYDSRYGIPARPGAGHHHEEEEPGEGEEGEEHGDVPVTIALDQIRADLRGELEIGGGFFETVRTRFAFADYAHTEFEGDEVGTVFETQGMEGRLELVQRDRDGWRGVIGGQFFNRDFAAIGAEAFVPANRTSQIGLFALQEFELGSASFEAAARYERSSVESDPLSLERSFDALSLAAGASYDIAPRFKLGANVSRSQRAPSAEELLSNGPHIATQAFEIGDPSLRVESSWGGELYARGTIEGVRFSGSLFANWFEGYIFEAATGAEEDGLPVFRYFQRDATYYGFEMEASVPLLEIGEFSLLADLVADYVHATIEDGGPVPRIPPFRILGGVEAQSDNIDARVDVEWSADQERVAALETRTEGHTFVNASIAWRPWGRNSSTSFLLSANNIFDVEARRHASFTKEYVPLPGRDIRLSARFSF